MKRILIIGRAFPNSAHGYINNDVDYLAAKAEVLVLSPNQPMAPFYSPVHFNYFNDEEDLIRQARQFRPDFIVAWLLPNHFFARAAAEALGVPFVLKLHTPDYHTLADQAKKRRLLPAIRKTVGEAQLARAYRVSATSLAATSRSSRLSGVYCIPGLRDEFCRHFPSEKVFELKPRIDVGRFHDETTNGDRIMLLGSLLKRREGRLSFGAIATGIGLPVDWFPMPTPGCLWMDVPDVPGNVNFMKYRPPSEMPALYKGYRAIVMVGEGRFSRGLSLYVLEAQAAGVAVVAPSLRPDFDDFVQAGGGYLFEDPSEIPGILRGIPDSGRRERGFRNVAAFDIQGLGEELRHAGLVL